MPDVHFEDSTTVLYFFCFMFGLALVPITYFLWPAYSKNTKPVSTVQRCNCYGCSFKYKRLFPTLNWKSKCILFTKSFFLVLIWLIFVYTAHYTISQQVNFKLYDPWEELDIDRDASLGIIKKKYHELSLIYHPDMKTGDNDKFITISKAYKTLTDPNLLKNFYDTGDPNGRRTMIFNIALPSILSDDKYSTWILLIYGLCFLVLFPTGVLFWWYRSIKYGNTQILSETSQLFGYCLHHYPESNIHRLKMILMCASEFSPIYSKKYIKDRPGNEKLLLKLAEKLPHSKPKLNVKPFNIHFAVKARILLLSYLQDISLTTSLYEELEYILGRCPVLWEHLANVCIEMMAYYKYRKTQFAPNNRRIKKVTRTKNDKGPNLETFERILILGPLITQRLNDSNSSPLLQLPHVNEEDFRHFTTKKRRIVSLDDLAALTLAERKKLFGRLTESEYNDVIAVIHGLPKVVMLAELEIVDIKDNTRVTPGALVTVNIYLQRRNLLSSIEPEVTMNNMGLLNVVDNISIQDVDTNCSINRCKIKATNNPQKSKNKKHLKKDKKTLHTSFQESTNLAMTQVNTTLNNLNNQGENTIIDPACVDEDKEFEILQKTILKKDKLKPSSRNESKSLPVHCPHFPGERQEGWWLYMSDHKTNMLIAAPKFISSLLNTFETELKFQAPLQTGHYQYEVALRSDSYIGLNCTELCSFTVFSPHSKQEEFDYGLDEIDKDNENDIIEQEETTSTEGSDSHDSGVEN